MRKIRVLVGVALLATTCGMAVLFADTFAAITGSGVGGAFITGDIWTAAIAEQVRQNFNVLNSRLAAVEAIYITATSTTTLTNKTLNAESTGNVLTITDHLWQPTGTCLNSGTDDPYVQFWHTFNTNAPTPVCFNGTNVIFHALDYVDAGNAFAQSNFRLPADWTGTIDAVIEWYSPATTGNVQFLLDTACVAVGESKDPSWNTSQTIVDATQGTANRLNTATVTGVTTTGCAAGEHLFFRLWRDPSNGSDTLTNSAIVIGIEWTYRRAM